MQTLNDHLTKQPRKLSPFHFYMKQYYLTKVKGEYDRLYPIMVAQYEEASEEERSSLKKPVPVNVRAEIGMRFWLAESEAFRQEIEKKRDDEYAKESEEWGMIQKKAKTPQEYHHQLTYAGQYIRPVAEAIATQMDVAVAIFLIGPVAEKNGDVEVRRFVVSTISRILFIDDKSTVFIRIGLVVCRAPLGRRTIPLGMQKLKNLHANMEEQSLVCIYLNTLSAVTEYIFSPRRMQAACAARRKPGSSRHPA